MNAGRRIQILGIVATVMCAGLGSPTRAQCIPQEVATLVPADGYYNDRFGRAVAISNDTVVVGAYHDDALTGSAYVFQRVGGAWTQTAKLIASDASQGNYFGFSVAISGNTIVVGAIGVAVSRGTVYVFENLSGVWSETAKLRSTTIFGEDYFGVAVAISDDTIAVGASREFDIVFGQYSGSAYIFQKLDGIWTRVAKLAASDASSDDYFGISVAITGETALVGALLADASPPRFSVGAAYVFQKLGGAWTQQAKLTASDAATSDKLGAAVALSGDTALVGAYGDDSQRGSAYVFDRVGGVWTQTAKLTASDRTPNDVFGYSVALSGDTALVGACFDLSDANGADSAYIFRRLGGVWTETTVLTASDATEDNHFGFAAISDETAVIGASGADHLPITNAGSAYIFDLCPPPACVACDTNCDGSINLFDIQPFVTALSPAPPLGCSPCAADTNADGSVNLFDIEGFVDCLSP